jgi:hypothetical protein
MLGKEFFDNKPGKHCAVAMTGHWQLRPTSDKNIKLRTGMLVLFDL